MLELVALLIFCGALTPIIKQKNRNKWLISIAPVLWIIGKYVAALVSSVICAVLEKAPEDAEMILHGSALFGGILGCVVAYLMIQFLPTKKLTCPKCDHKFVNNSEWGVTCENCDTKLRVSNDQVTVIETA